MLPLHDDNPTSRPAVVTIGLIAANVAVFFSEPLVNGPAAQARFFFCKAAIPFEVVHRHLAPQLAGACPGKNVWLSVLYSMFLHAGLLHIAGNMLFLWIFGNNVEDALGRLKFFIFYLICGAAAAFAQSYANPTSLTPLVGASGAIAGVLGAYLLLYPRARVTTFVFFILLDLPAWTVLAGWFVLQVFQSAGSLKGSSGGGVAYLAHVGGFVAGMLLLLLLRPRTPRGAVPDGA